MNLHGRPDTQPTLEAAEIVIDDVTLDHTDQFLPAGEASAVVPFPLEDPPEARRPDTQPTLEAAEIVIDDVTLDHTDQFLPAGEASAVVPFPLEDPPEALHGAVVDAFSHSGHALRNAGCGQLVPGW